MLLVFKIFFAFLLLPLVMLSVTSHQTTSVHFLRSMSDQVLLAIFYLIFYIYENMCILYNQRDATYTMFFIIISALRVSGGISAHHQELIKLYVPRWVLSCFPAV